MTPKLQLFLFLLFLCLALFDKQIQMTWLLFDDPIHVVLAFFFLIDSL